MLTSECYSLQRDLSQAQGHFIIGMPVSVLKAAFSVAQAVTGIALSILTGTAAVVFFSPTMLGRCAQSLAHTGMGVFGFIYAASNFISLGIVGSTLEG